MLILQKLSVGYPGTRGAVLSNVDVSAERGAFICILGRNGAGKSTLMRSIAGLQAPLAGQVALDGEDVGAMRAVARARKFAVVLTERQFSPGLRVEDVVALGRQPFTDWRGRLNADDKMLVATALEQAGALRFASRLIDDLSDGERQRVMIARAIAQAPQVMILDEITAFLDLPGRVEVMTWLRRLAHERGHIIILSSHDLELSLQIADRLWLLDGRGGFENGPPGALAASGAIGHAFDTADVTFSSALGRFELSGGTEAVPQAPA